MNDAVVSFRRPENLSRGHIPGLAETPQTELATTKEPSMASVDLDPAHWRLLKTLVELRTELVDMAFDLEQRPYLHAADLASVLANRLDKIITEASPPAVVGS